MRATVSRMKLRARTLHRLANMLDLPANAAGMAHNSAMLLQGAAQKIEHLEARIDASNAARQADLYRAWEEGHGHCFHVENPANRERNPYSPKETADEPRP